jgi:hypothetical protein
MPRKATEQNEKEFVRFERPLPVRIMAIDGTWCVNSRLIEITDNGAQVEMTGHAVELTEFFLMLTTFGNPVFRRCRREWVRGAQVGVSFKKINIGIESFDEAQRKDKILS